MKIHQVFDDAHSELEPTITFVGHQQCEPDHAFSGRRDHFVLHYVLAGEGAVASGGKTHHLNSGDTFFIFPHTRNRYRASSSRPWKYTWVGFSGESVAGILASIGVTPAASVIQQNLDPDIEQLFGRMYEELASRRLGYRIKATSLFLDLVYRLIESQHRKPVIVAKQVDYVETAIRFIENHYNQRITIEGISNTLGINRSHLSRLFHGAVGQTIQEYLVSYRIERAKEYITHTDDRIDEIAHSCGYVSYYSFANRFRTVVGVSPTEYRRARRVQTQQFFFDT